MSSKKIKALKRKIEAAELELKHLREDLADLEGTDDDDRDDDQDDDDEESDDE